VQDGFRVSGCLVSKPSDKPAQPINRRMETVMKNSLFDQAAVLAAAHGAISISALQRAFRCGYAEAARIVDELHAAGVVGEYDSTEMRPYLGGGKKQAWHSIRAQCFEILKMSDEPARGWWMAMDSDRRSAVMRAAVVPFVHLSKAWDELPEGARRDLRAAHDKRRATWAKLNAEFSGRVAA
jgi:hypothetical protein